MNGLKAIETEYKGYRFRSRLEARWAVFFDACGVKWEYEPEGYDLGDGTYYLPDFLLHGVTVNHATYAENCDIYVEVKGQMNDADADKIKRFAEAGMPEDFFTIDMMSAYDQLGYITGESVEDDLVNEIFSKFCMGK